MLNSKEKDYPTPRRSFIVEMDLTIFETPVPPQHLWPMVMGNNYKTIWHGVLTQTVK